MFAMTVACPDSLPCPRMMPVCIGLPPLLPWETQPPPSGLGCGSVLDPLWLGYGFLMVWLPFRNIGAVVPLWFPYGRVMVPLRFANLSQHPPPPPGAGS